MTVEIGLFLLILGIFPLKISLNLCAATCPWFNFSSAGNLLETCPRGLGTKILCGHVKEKMADKTAKSGTLAYSLNIPTPPPLDFLN